MRSAGCLTKRRARVWPTEAALLIALISASALEVIPSAQPQHVFADGKRTVEVRLRNDGAETARMAVRLQLLQLTSATATPVGGARTWKTLIIMPDQTVLENAVIEFPKLRVSTRFAARWLAAEGKVLGVTEVWAHPDNLLDRLKLLAGEQPLGLSDATGALRPALVARGIPVSELNSAESWSEFRGRLAFVVSKPEASQGELRLDAGALARTKEGVAVVWFRPRPATSSPMPPLAERVTTGRGAVVLAPTSMLDKLDRSPAAQLTLVRLAELALSQPVELLASHP